MTMTPPQKLAVDMGLICEKPCDCFGCDVTLASITKSYAEGRRAGLEEAVNLAVYGKDAGHTLGSVIRNIRAVLEGRT